MRRITAFAAVLSILMMVLPVLACAATPKMSRTEQDCCRQMHGKCTQSGMQSCCQVRVRHELSQLPNHVVSAPAVSLISSALLSPLLVGLPSSGEYLWHVPDEHSPPGLLITHSTVLRI